MALSKSKSISASIPRKSGKIGSALSDKISYSYVVTLVEHKEEARLIYNSLKSYNWLSIEIDNSDNSTISNYKKFQINMFFGSTKSKHAQSKSAINVTGTEMLKSYYFYSEDLDYNILSYINKSQSDIEFSSIPKQLILNNTKTELEKYGDTGVLLMISGYPFEGASEIIATTTPAALSLDLMQCVSVICKQEQFTESILKDFCNEISSTFLSTMYSCFPCWLKSELTSNLRISKAITKYLEFFLFGLSNERQ